MLHLQNAEREAPVEASTTAAACAAKCSSPSHHAILGCCKPNARRSAAPTLSLSLFFSTLLPTTWPRPVVSTTRPRPAVSTACRRPRRLLRLPAHPHRPSPPPGPAVGGGHTAVGMEKSDMSVWREKSGRRERRRSAPPRRRGRLLCPVTGSAPSRSRLAPAHGLQSRGGGFGGG
jgi:hypothetical protein